MKWESDKIPRLKNLQTLQFKNLFHIFPSLFFLENNNQKKKKKNYAFLC